jgi:hypothetical protein
MRLFRRHPEPPSRDPHPNPRVEVQLQQIISLRRAAARNEGLLDAYRTGITRVNGVIGANSGSDFNEDRRRDIDEMNTEITRLTGETAELHGQIAELCAKLADDDLLWLDPRPARNHAGGRR